MQKAFVGRQPVYRDVDQFFTVRLFSLLDALVDRPMEDEGLLSILPGFRPWQTGEP